MKRNYTHIAIILDRTGSMYSILDDTIGGFNAFLARQKAEKEEATLTLVQFDSQDPYEVIHRMKALKDVPELTRATYMPRAHTPLLDAIGLGIIDLERCLEVMSEDARPEKVVMVIVTDGKENYSREFKREQIQKMIVEKQEKNDWRFVFLSADLLAVHNALADVVPEDGVMYFDKDTPGTAAAWGSVTSLVENYRTNLTNKTAFTREDRAKQEIEKKNKKKKKQK